MSHTDQQQEQINNSSMMLMHIDNDHITLMTRALAAAACKSDQVAEACRNLRMEGEQIVAGRNAEHWRMIESKLTNGDYESPISMDAKPGETALELDEDSVRMIRVALLVSAERAHLTQIDCRSMNLEVAANAAGLLCQNFHYIQDQLEHGRYEA